MATKTPNLGLIKPAKGEFFNAWDIPVNDNWDVLDTKVGDTISETEDSRGSQASLKERLNVALNPDGTLKDVPEVADARNSTVYGADDGVNSFDLDDRIEQGDREVYDARQGRTKLKDMLAFAQNDSVHNSVLSAPGGFLSFTGAVAKVDGSVTSVVCNINGYRAVVRSLKSHTISGASGTYYIYLDRSSPDLLLDRTGGGQDTGVVSVDGGSGKLKKFSDSTQNFNTSGVKAGDILEITTAGSENLGEFVVASVESDTELFIVGLFETAQTTLNYKITDPLAPSLNSTTTAPSLTFAEEADRIYIGRAVFDGANITSIFSYALKGRYAAFSAVTPVSGDFSIAISHNLGYVPKRVLFYGSQTSDFTSALEPLSVSQDSGGTLQRSVIARFTDTTLDVKNAVNGIFYKDFSGVSQTSGFIYIVIER